MKELKQLKRDKTLPPTPWKSLLTSTELLSKIFMVYSTYRVITQFGHGFGYFTVVTDLPKYMNDVLKYNIKSTGLFSSLPYVAMWICTISFGYISDYCIKRNYISLTKSRKLYTTLSFTVPGLFLVAASFSGCDRTLATIMFCFAMGTY
jgi:MFS transporter, ACS family, solute carrier family 17 (sodium-dependent inorganic phosphate cotransporter), other